MKPASASPPDGSAPSARLQSAIRWRATLTLTLGIALAACAAGVDLDPALADAPMPDTYGPVDAELADAGAWLFQRNCSACHSIGGGSLIGPDLSGVTERRSLDWIAAMIRRPDSMMAADTIAQRLRAEYQVPMADRRLDGARIRALIEFLRRADIGPGPADSRVGRTEGGVEWERAGDGPVVVLVHGTNLDREVWRGLRHRLGGDHSVVSYDLRSHGGSADADGPWSDVADLDEVLDAAEVGASDPIILVGLSAGAGIALDYALEHGGRVTRLVMVSPSVRGFVPDAGDVPDVFGPLMAALATGSSEAIGDAMVALPTFAVPPDQQAGVDAMVRRNLRLFDVDPAWASPRDVAPLERLDGLTSEMVILVGERDFPATASLAAHLTDEVASAIRISIPDGGHLLPLTHPEALMRAVVSTLSQLRD